jgi:hypothetical protein
LKRFALTRDREQSKENEMAHNISIMVIGLCLFVLWAMLLPDDFAMPIDDDGNLSKRRDWPYPDAQPVRRKKNGPSGDRPWGR